MEPTTLLLISCSILNTEHLEQPLLPLLQSVNFLCSSTRPFCFSPSIVSALLVDNRLSSRHFHSSPSIVFALLVSRSASVRRLFMLFSSINRFSSRQFCSRPSINHFSSRQFRSSPSITSAMDLGRVRQKKWRV